MTEYFCICYKIFLSLWQIISASVAKYSGLSVTKYFCQSWHSDLLGLLLSESVRPSWTNCQINFAPILFVAEEHWYLSIFLCACFFQNRIFEMQFFHLCEKPCQSKKILYFEGKWKDGRKIKSHLRQFLFKFWAASPLVWWPAEHQVHLMANRHPFPFPVIWWHLRSSSCPEHCCTAWCSAAVAQSSKSMHQSFVSARINLLPI